MDGSNLRLFSNIFPWKGRWRDGDQELVSKIWDDKALMVLKAAERKKELELSPYQDELYNCTIQCPSLPQGERPWGWIAAGVVACRCRNVKCWRFYDCRRGQDVTEDERRIWAGAIKMGWLLLERRGERTRSMLPKHEVWERSI